MGKERFYRCCHCGNLVGMIHNSGVPIICCGEPMEQMVPGSVEASKEKHVPVVTTQAERVVVNIGAEPHPMTQEHWIQWVYLQTAQGGQRKCLHPGDIPQVKFVVTPDDIPQTVYAYCNLHGLWKTDLEH